MVNEIPPIELPETVPVEVLNKIPYTSAVPVFDDLTTICEAEVVPPMVLFETLAKVPAVRIPMNGAVVVPPVYDPESMMAVMILLLTEFINADPVTAR